MHNQHKNVDEIIRDGFSPLPVDPGKASDVAGRILLDAEKQSETSTIVRFKMKELYWRYALAALLVFGVGLFIFFPQYISNTRNESLVNNTSLQDSVRCNVSVVASLFEGEWKPTIGKTFVTDKQVQVLIAVGVRTHTLVFEESEICVNRADMKNTVVALSHGVIAVDVEPGRGNDTVTIVTRNERFIQLGTRFSIMVDSITGSSTLEVYRGSVRVESASGNAVVVTRGQAWSSFSGSKIHTLVREKSELDQLDEVFSKNELPKLLEWNSGEYRYHSVIPEKIIRKSRLKSVRSTETTVDTVADSGALMKTVIDLLQKNEYSKIDSVINNSNAFDAQKMSELLFKHAKQKTNVFQFTAAAKILNIITENRIFPLRRREDASMRSFILHKEYMAAGPAELYELVKEHEKHFPKGVYADEIAIEMITQLLALRNYSGAIREMDHFIKNGKLTTEIEYYSYLYASTLRENLKRKKEALRKYESYINRYPDGKYGEDALYWLVQLNLESGKNDIAKQYVDIYLEKYPNGHWAGLFNSGQVMK